jgi:D-arabinose 1-dehydrogenase-like Zn-dependent alcohol dehydrogenase
MSMALTDRNQILAKVLASGVCHSDALVKHAGFGNSFPIVPGHEVVAEVVAVPDTEKRWKVGDWVGGAWHGGHCGAYKFNRPLSFGHQLSVQTGHCKPCRRGLFQMCVEETVNGVYRDGGYGEYVDLRTEAAVALSRDIDPAAYAPLLCAGVTVYNSLRRQNVMAGDLVAIQGLGGLGHLALQYVNKMGYRTVAISSSSAKKEFAMKLGAHEYIDSSKGGEYKRRPLLLCFCRLTDILRRYR